MCISNGGWKTKIYLLSSSGLGIFTVADVIVLGEDKRGPQAYTSVSIPALSRRMFRSLEVSTDGWTTAVVLPGSCRAHKLFRPPYAEQTRTITSMCLCARASALQPVYQHNRSKVCCSKTASPPPSPPTTTTTATPATTTATTTARKRAPCTITLFRLPGGGSAALSGQHLTGGTGSFPYFGVGRVLSCSVLMMPV